MPALFLQKNLVIREKIDILFQTLLVISNGCRGLAFGLVFPEHSAMQFKHCVPFFPLTPAVPGVSGNLSASS